MTTATTTQWDLAATIRRGQGRSWLTSYFGDVEGAPDTEEWVEAYTSLEKAKADVEYAFAREMGGPPIETRWTFTQDDRGRDRWLYEFERYEEETL